MLNRLLILSALIPIVLHSQFLSPRLSSAPELAGGPRLLNDVAIPSDFPIFEAQTIKPGIADGRIFLNNWQGTPYIMILENDGTPYFYQRVQERSRDFKVQPNGMLTRRLRTPPNGFVLMDSSYAVIDTMQAVNGFTTDEHELCMLENGHYFLIAIGYRNVDLSEIVDGGNPNATIKDTHVQGFDENGSLTFEWLCHDYYDITDMIDLDASQGNIDYVHMNSIAVDYDGHLILSANRLSEVTKINSETGDIIWRLGGKNNQFEFINDEHGISRQHDARPVPGKPNHYTIFDNGNHHQPHFSRAVEFKLDTDAMTATRVWEYRHPTQATGWMGNAQRLPNGNTFINWADGSMPKATEVTPDGEVVYQGDFVDHIDCYRAFRFEWDNPSDRPYLLVEPLPDQIALLFNQFGVEDIEKYIIYGAPRRFREIPIDTTTQPLARLTTLQNNTLYEFGVRTINSQGELSELSNIVSARTNYFNPGENLLDNGNFDNELDPWELAVSGGADARMFTRENGAKLIISNGGSAVWHVQLRQGGVPLVKGKQYRFEFDARADGPRSVDAKLERAASPWENYGKINPTVLSRQKKHFVYEFTMQDASNYDARVVFNSGASAHDIYLENVSVTQIEPTTVNQPAAPQTVLLESNAPNPFNPQTTIRYHLPTDGRVTLTVFNTLGEKVQTLVHHHQAAGRYQVQFNGNGLASGVYFYRLDVHGATPQTRIRKMLLVK